METSETMQRGETWLLQRMKHTAGIYGFFTSLAQAARREPGLELCWWETGQYVNAATGWVSSGTI